MINRVKVVLPQEEYSALLKLSESELRNPQDQIRAVLRQELVRRGLLEPPAAPVQTATGGSENGRLQDV